MRIESTAFTKYCPEILYPQNQVMTADWIYITPGLRYPLPQNCSYEITYRSLENFINRANHQGLNQLATGFVKRNAALPEGDFYLSPPIMTPYPTTKDRYGGSSYRFNRDGTGYFFFDGEYSFALGWQDPKNQLWIGVTSFFLNHPFNDRSACYSQDLHYNRPNSAIIVQFQAPSFPTYPDDFIRQQAFDIANSFHWESVLTSMVVQWAESIELDSVSILPASMNKYRERDRFSLLRAKILYDANARRCGFKKDAEGFYSFNL